MRFYPITEAVIAESRPIDPIFLFTHVYAMLQIDLLSEFLDQSAHVTIFYLVLQLLLIDL